MVMTGSPSSSATTTPPDALAVSFSPSSTEIVVDLSLMMPTDLSVVAIASLAPVLPTSTLHFDHDMMMLSFAIILYFLR